LKTYFAKTKSHAIKDLKNNGNNNIKQIMIIVAYLSVQANLITARHIFTVLQKFEVNAASLHHILDLGKPRLYLLIEKHNVRQRRVFLWFSNRKRLETNCTTALVG
jgi:hypothetical protein